ncbi:MAG: transketolase C-terminal domain-containing protein [Sporomusaceae bacterium]|nr:transketolase C-terminal domain-containing protein [Sporomusaceae bacterium]
MPKETLEKGRRFITGNQAIALAALAAKADALFGYPITPQTEVMQYWTKYAPDFNKLFLQTEDELSAGYYTLGAVMTGKKAFTSTAGPGNVLMQEPMAMAEMMRIPAVFVIQQRGGPSTATVIYGQQETTLTAFGGNGEGLRIVYSTASHQELFDYTIKAFNRAWQYRFPAYVLGDGYQGKMRESLTVYDPTEAGMELVKPYPLVGKDAASDYEHYRNTYNTEEELYEVLQEHLSAYQKMTPQIVEWEEENCDKADVILVSHGIVSRSCRAAAKILQQEGRKIGFFRPITLRPFPAEQMRQAVQKAKHLLLFESAEGQFYRMVTEALYGLNVPITKVFRPGLGITTEEVYRETAKLEI